MKTAIFGVLFLSGCASAVDYWQPESLTPKTVTLHFLDREQWVAFQTERKNCGDSCGLIADHIGGTAYWIGGPDNATNNHCHIYIPAYKGMPSYHTFTHEIRHCYQGPHFNWN